MKSEDADFVLFFFYFTFCIIGFEFNTCVTWKRRSELEQESGLVVEREGHCPNVLTRHVETIERPWM